MARVTAFFQHHLSAGDSRLTTRRETPAVNWLVRNMFVDLKHFAGKLLGSEFTAPAQSTLRERLPQSRVPSDPLDCSRQSGDVQGIDQNSGVSGDFFQRRSHRTYHR